eukprot:173802-Hanusia_phi.AAC.1
MYRRRAKEALADGQPKLFCTAGRIHQDGKEVFSSNAAGSWGISLEGEGEAGLNGCHGHAEPQAARDRRRFLRKTRDGNELVSVRRPRHPSNVPRAPLAPAAPLSPPLTFPALVGLLLLP